MGRHPWRPVLYYQLLHVGVVGSKLHESLVAAAVSCQLSVTVQYSTIKVWLKQLAAQAWGPSLDLLGPSLDLLLTLFGPFVELIGPYWISLDLLGLSLDLLWTSFGMFRVMVCDEL